MRAEELRELSNVELSQKLEDSREALFNLRFDKVMNRLENTSRIKVIKRDIARILTIIQQRKNND